MIPKSLARRGLQVKCLTGYVLGFTAFWFAVGIAGRALGDEQKSGETPASSGDSVEVKPLSFQESVEIALKNNPRVITAEKQRRAAIQRVDQADSQFGPRVDLTASHTLQGPVVSFSPAPGAPVTTIVPDNRNDVIVSLSHTLYAGQSIPAVKKSASLGVRAAGDNLENVRQDVVLQTKSAYYQVLRAQDLKTVSEEYLRSVEEHLRIARANFDVGTVPRFDVLRSEVEVADAKQSLVQAENAVSLAKAAFNNALGRDVSTPVILQAVTFGEFTVPDLEASIQQSLRQRPEILSLEKNLWIAKENVKIQKSGNDPAVNLGANYHRQTATGFGSNDYSWDASMSLSLPLFDRGLTKAQVREARELVAETESVLEETRQGVTLEVKQSVLNVLEAKQRIETATKGLEAAEESLRIAELRYKEGVGTQLEATDARLARNRARTNYTQALYDYQSALAAWENAVGIASVR